MLKSKQLTLALLINATLISTAFASEQSESKGFVEDAEGTVLFRTGYINRDKKALGVKDQSSATQSAIFDLEVWLYKRCGWLRCRCCGRCVFQTWRQQKCQQQHDST